jgi:thioredoxin 1
VPVESLSLEELSNLVKTEEIPLVVDFWASWCAPCKALAPFLDSLSDKYEGTIKVVKVNISENQEAGVKYGITSIPCLIVFKDRKEVDRTVGFKGKEALESLEALFSKHTRGS